MIWDVVVIGGGAAGLFAATAAAGRGKRTLLLEKNDRLGVKILMSGGTRCNLTQDCDAADIVRAYGKQGRFLRAALAALSPPDLVALANAAGVPTKVEPGGKIFPVSNRAADVLAAWENRTRRSGCEILLGEPLLDIERQADAFTLRTSRQVHTTRRLVITTGGKSYPGCGTSGDGYAWAEQFGHTMTPTHPALTPLACQPEWVRRLKGVTLPDAGVRVLDPQIVSTKKSLLAERRGSLLFTHFGVSGPPVLDVSREVSRHVRPQSLALEFDFAPGFTDEAFEQQLVARARQEGKKPLSALLPVSLPQRLAAALFELAEVDPAQRGAELSKPHRRALVQCIKRQRVAIAGALGYAKAEVTQGGVALGEVDPRTMQSKLMDGLFFAGEILDIDGPIGGYNFQAAFSTGHLAGLSV